MTKEEGEASIKIELKNGIITVYHGTDRDILYKKHAKEGDWDKIWNGITGKKLKRKLKRKLRDVV
jgi:hypothetical protein